ncbi:hypothetical protein LSG31_13525 [Fodinisporobacter ferrooxydans]|uniref:Uncharacterized protein n=1 Tax=Fodinisporobacter ferrooxydans TaxID=2901836 RepID=A0ABY4CEL1_9BACL|nr:hypothetical protein LSG31_13525 [Alicyclobacillaceae bacterium MYW30-H2]
MNIYGQVTLMAVQLIETKQVSTPLDARNLAAKNIIISKSSQKKSCPKNAFLGLCEAGLVYGIPRGIYSEKNNAQKKNKEYVIKAVELLRLNLELADDKNALWAAVMNGKDMSHNSQMDVVLALWRKGRILTTV